MLESFENNKDNTTNLQDENEGSLQACLPTFRTAVFGIASVRFTQIDEMTCTGLLFYPFIHTAEDTTCEQKATGSVFFERKKSADQAREQFNAQKRAAYRNKKDENMVRLQKENQPSLPKTGK